MTTTITGTPRRRPDPARDVGQHAWRHALRRDLICRRSPCGCAEIGGPCLLTDLSPIGETTITDREPGGDGASQPGCAATGEQDLLDRRGRLGPGPGERHPTGLVT